MLLCCRETLIRHHVGSSWDRFGPGDKNDEVGAGKRGRLKYKLPPASRLVVESRI